MPDEPVDFSVIDDALRSRDDEAPWSVAWGKLPEGLTSVRVTFRSGRRSQPAARVGVLGRHWAAEVAGRFDKHWGLAAVILQPVSEDRPELPDIRSAGEH